MTSMIDKKGPCDISIRIGGEAGQGMNSLSGLLGNAYVLNGYHVLDRKSTRLPSRQVRTARMQSSA